MSEATQEQDVSTEGYVEISVDDLLIGSTLDHPLCDAAGVLLLAEGTTITAGVKKKLALREGQVRVSGTDLGNVTLDESLVSDRKGISIGSEMTKQLDSIIDQGILFTKNNGPAVQDGMVFQGRKAFDSQKREELLLQHQATSESLDSMMREAVHGRQLNGKQITQLVATYLTDMTEDSENVVTVAMEADKRGLSDQSLQTALLAMTIGVEMKLDADNVRLLGICGLVHDWGMTLVPQELLHCNRPLTSVEFLEIQKHPIHTVGLLQRINGIPGIVPLVVYQVHEKINGTGYPRGRRGNSIHLFARILNVADTYAALTTRRPFRPALTGYAAMECLLHQAAQKSVDPQCVSALLNAFSLFPIGSYVVLDDGSIAQVLRPNRGDYHNPIIQLVRDPRGQKVEQTDESVVDLKESERSIIQAIRTPGKNEVGFSAELITGSAGTKFRSEELE